MPVLPVEFQKVRWGKSLHTSVALGFDTIIGAGKFTEIHQGWTELGGITTLSPFRRRGIAAVVTAFLTQEAFRQGATRAFLLAGKQASRVYERVGFLPSATLMVYEASPSSVR